MRSLAAIYVRVSTGQQEAEGSSLVTQREACERYAAEHGLTVAATYSDTHTGSELWERPQLTALREAIARREYDHVIVYALDRLARKVPHQMIVAAECERWGVTLHCVSEPIDSSVEGQLISTLRGHFAEVEREKIRERTIRGKLAKLRSGQWIWGAKLYGYRQGEQRTVNEYEAAVVRQVYTMAAEGVSQHQIARALNEQGVPTLAKEWTQGRVRKMLANPAYKGVAVTLHRNGEERIVLPDGTLPAIVSPDLWDRAWATRSRGDAARNEKRRYLLRGLIWCAVCGSRMYGEPNRSRGRSYRIYRCRTTKTTAKCGARQVMAERVEREVWQAVTDELANPERMADMVVERDDTPALLAQIDGLERDVRRIDSRAGALLDELAERPAFADVGRRKLDEYERQKAELRRRIDRLRLALKRERDTLAQKRAVVDLAEELRGQLAGADWGVMRRVLERLQIRVLAEGRTAEVELFVPVPALVADKAF